MNKDEFENEQQEYFDDDLLSNINESLAKQINEEMEDDFDPDAGEEGTPDGGKNKMPKWKRIFLIVGAVMLVLIVGGGLTINGILNRMRVNEFNGEQVDEIFEEDDVDGDELDPNSVEWIDPNILRSEDDVINLLLVGEEAIGSGGSRGRTDSIMIATLNVKQKAFKLTSLMRDTYVRIPGYSDNKLNAAYHNGGMPLLVETIKKNFGVELDGAVLVNFDGFEKIIDKLGGVEITLTAAEASYLNRTNYISKKQYRNVREGKQTLNGNQALGYSRVRYVRTEDSGADDFGRTGRQRKVLNAVFEKYKSKNAAELVFLLDDLLPYIQTDIDKQHIISYIYTAVTMGVTELQTLRIPIDNGYTPANIRKMSVLVPDLAKNINALHEFIFGDVGDVSDLLNSPAASYNNTTNSNSTYRPPTSTNTQKNNTTTSTNNNSQNSNTTKPPATNNNTNNNSNTNKPADKPKEEEVVETPETPPVEETPTDNEGGETAPPDNSGETPSTENPSTETSNPDNPKTENPNTGNENEMPSTEIPSTDVTNPTNENKPTENPPAENTSGNTGKSDAVGTSKTDGESQTDTKTGKIDPSVES